MLREKNGKFSPEKNSSPIHDNEKVHKTSCKIRKKIP